MSIDTRKSSTGWTIETTSERDGWLVAGGRMGHRAWISNRTLAAHRIDPSVDPSSSVNDFGTTWAEYAIEHIQPDRILDDGVLIR